MTDRQVQVAGVAREGQRAGEAAAAGAGPRPAPPDQPAHRPQGPPAAHAPENNGELREVLREFNRLMLEERPGNLPAHRPKLRNFNGDAAYPLTEFIQDFEAYCHTTRVPEAARAAILIDHLRGDPLKEVRASSAAERADYEQVRARLEAQFQRRSAAGPVPLPIPGCSLSSSSWRWGCCFGPAG